MIRVLIITLIRIFLASLAVYFLLMIGRKVVQFLRGNKPLFTFHKRNIPDQPTPKETEKYKDVQEARFEELPTCPRNNESDQQE